MTARQAFAGVVTFFAVLVLTPSQLRAQKCSGCWECQPDKAQCSLGSDILALDCACAMGDCANAIPCHTELPMLEGELYTILDRQDYGKLSRFIQDHPDQVQFVVDRNGIALKGCGENLYSFFTVPRPIAMRVALAFAGRTASGLQAVNILFAQRHQGARTH